LFLAELVFAIAGPERTKNLAGEVFRLIQDPFNVPILKRPANLSRQYAALPKRIFDFHKRGQLFIGVRSSLFVRRDSVECKT
jgi:hypothetical protein